MSVQRCAWPKNDLAIRYHDEEWGVPVHDDRLLFEAIVLDGAQAGLSWDTVLKKRPRYREVFAGFDPEIVARFDDVKVAELLADPGIIRNRLKIASAISNAQATLAIQEQYGSLDRFLWQFVNGQTIHHHRRQMSDIPATSPESDAMSKALKNHGFRFVGSTICYALMQAVGMVNDHTTDCFRHAQLLELSAQAVS